MVPAIPEALFSHSISSQAFCISIVLETLPLTCGLSCILFHGVKVSFNNLAVLFGMVTWLWLISSSSNKHNNIDYKRI